MSEVAVCATVRFAASGWVFCPRFARAPSGVGVSTPSVASTNLEQNLSAIIPQTGEISRLANTHSGLRSRVWREQKYFFPAFSRGEHHALGAPKAHFPRREVEDHDHETSDKLIR